MKKAKKTMTISQRSYYEDDIDPKRYRAAKFERYRTSESLKGYREKDDLFDDDSEE